MTTPEQQQEQPPTLYDRIGGSTAVRAAVSEFYDRLLADPRVAPFFKDTSMVKLRAHQIRFFELAFKGFPKDMDVPQLIKDKHERLFVEQGLNETHFDLVAMHFGDTLRHLKIDPDLVDEAIGVISPLRDIFVEGAKAHSQSTLRDE
jgi:hemoglobin